VSAVLAEEVGRAPIVPLSEVAGLVRGVSYPKADAREEPAPGFVPVLRATNIQDARLILDSDLVFVAERNVSPEQLLRPGDIVVATSSGSKHLVGKSGQLHAAWQGSFGAFCATIRPRPGIHPRYLALFLQAPAYWSQITKKALGVNINNLRRGDLESLELPLPPLGVQASVVAEIEKQFSRLDEAVTNLNRVKANLKRQRSSTLQAVTSGRLAAEGRPVPRPNEWQWLTIEELASSAPRSIQSGPFGSNLKHSEFQASGRLVIGIDNVRDGAFSLGSNHRISEPKFQELAKYAARPGDVLITVMDTIGRVCVVPQDIEPAIITKHVYRVTVNRELAIPDYVAIALRGSREVRAQLMGSVQGQTRPGLNGGLIKKIRVPVPPLAYQQSIVAEVDRRLSIVREVEAEVDGNLKRAQALRQAVLAWSFSH